MKSGFLMCITATALLVALAMTVSLAAQKHPTTHHRYKLIDLETLGAPTGYLCNDPTNDGGPCLVLNNRGTVVSAADTSLPNPNYPNICLVCPLEALTKPYFSINNPHNAPSPHPLHVHHPAHRTQNPGETILNVC
jgi:hypothetical protein